MAAKRISLNDVLEELQLNEDFSKTPAEIYICPPDENNGEATDEASADEDGVDFNVNNGGRKLLSAEAEMVDIHTAQSSTSRFYGTPKERPSRLKRPVVSNITLEKSDESQSEQSESDEEIPPPSKTSKKRVKSSNNKNKTKKAKSQWIEEDIA